MLKSALGTDVYVRKKKKKSYLSLSEVGGFFNAYCEEASFEKIFQYTLNH